jgi:hypothetical protein
MAIRKKTIVNAINKRSSIFASDSLEKKPEQRTNVRFQCVLPFRSCLHPFHFPKVPARRFAFGHKHAPNHEARTVKGNETTQIDNDNSCGPLP